MTKKDMANAIAQATRIDRTRVLNIVQQLFDGIIDLLVQEGRVELRGFGVFEVKRRKPRPARNPRTGERLWVPERFFVSFKAGQVVRDRVRQGDRRPSPAQLANNDQLTILKCSRP